MRVLNRVPDLIGKKLFSFKNGICKYLREGMEVVLRKKRSFDLGRGMRKGFLEEVKCRHGEWVDLSRQR